jgi:uncharacterized protein YjiS (DUF1127 family)
MPVNLRRNALKRGVQQMIGTRNVLDDLAEWYSLPTRLPSAGAHASVLRPVFAPSSRSETLWSTTEGRLTAIVEQLLAWHDRARERRALLRLSDDLLVDIGISRTDALKEAGKAFWRS